MNNLSQYIIEKLHLNKDIKIEKYNYHPKDGDELKSLVYKLIKERGNEDDLNDIDTSNITDMNNLFAYSEFNGDISKWDVSHVTSMTNMFCWSKFNGDISSWNVSKVVDMRSMFQGSEFNQDISEWDVSNVTKMDWMFAASNFNGDISKWDVSKVKTIDMYNMFKECPLENNSPTWYKK